MRPISRWWKYLFSRVSAACGALTPCSRTFMDEPPRKSGGAEVRGEYVMKSTRSEETSMSVLDDYLVDPNVSLLSKTLIRGVGPRIDAANDNQASLLVKVKSANDNQTAEVAELKNPAPSIQSGVAGGILPHCRKHPAAANQLRRDPS